MKQPTLHQISKLPKWAVDYIRKHRQAIVTLNMAIEQLDHSYGRAQKEIVATELDEAVSNGKVVLSTWPIL